MVIGILLATLVYASPVVGVSGLNSLRKLRDGVVLACFSAALFACLQHTGVT